MKLESLYLKHRLGVIIAIGEFTFLMTFFLENMSILETAMGLPLFFWMWSTLLLPAPLILGLSLRESLKFFAYFLPLLFLSGLIAFIVPTQLVINVVSILAIAWILILIFLTKRKPEVFDLKPRIDPLTFLESIVIFGLSFLCSYITISLNLVDKIPTFSSLFTNYLVLGLIFYLALSITTISLRFFIKKHQG